MAKIKIVDLPKDMKVTREEMKKVFGGAVFHNARFANAMYSNSTFPNALISNAPLFNDISTANLIVTTVPDFVPS